MTEVFFSQAIDWRSIAGSVLLDGSPAYAIGRNIDVKTGKQVKPDISDMPQFEFKPESLKASIARALPDILIMVLLIIVFFAGAFVSFLRYDVR